MTIRVAHLLDGRHFGGAEEMVRRLARSSPHIDVSATVYCLGRGRLSSFLQQEAIPHRVFPMSSRFTPGPLTQIKEAVKRDQIQILQAHTSRTHLMARYLSWELGIPNITTIQSPIALDENQGKARHNLRAWVERMGRPWTNHICCVSQEETERLIREEKVPPNKTTWIPNGVDAVDFEFTAPERQRTQLLSILEQHGLAPDAFVIAMVASLRPRKGPEVLIRAFGRFLQGGGQGLLLFIGDDEFTRAGKGTGYLPQLQSLAKELRADKSIRFAGFCEAPWALAREADVIALPSLFGEGMPLALLEAMNHGKAIIASDTMGNRELVEHGVNGWLHEPGDDAMLAGQIREASADRELARKTGLEGRRKFLEKFELGIVLRQWRDLYERLVPMRE